MAAAAKTAANGFARCAAVMRKDRMLSPLLFHCLLIFSILLGLSLTSPTPKSHHLAIRSPSIWKSPTAFQKNGRPKRQLQQRSTISDLLAGYPSIASSDLFLSAPPPSTRYRFFLTSYNFYPANSASVALSSFYGAIGSQSSSFGGQNIETKSAIAFGAGRLWINSYAKEDERLVWKDLEWLAVKSRGWVEKGLVGTWNGVLWPPGRAEGIVIEVKIVQRRN
ncbi:MAG: hypothetical protein L6R41_006188 [Letrouitia leprolyta]|nr:MAG: hypothetical protein L6R41_006188 [Letrouitia leprolyta]